MTSIKPIYVIVLLIAIVVFGVSKLMNPHKKYSTQKYWQTATLEFVEDVPEVALQPGNKNGGVLMWAAIGTSNPEIIKALVERGADVNESDPIFGGTPLSGAAGYSSNPNILRTLIDLGADIDKTVMNNATVLMVAAQYNTNPGIIEELISLGSDINAKNLHGDNALNLARKYKNSSSEEVLMKLMKQ